MQQWGRPDAETLPCCWTQYVGKMAFVGMEIADFRVFSVGDMKAVSPMEI